MKQRKASPPAQTHFGSAFGFSAVSPSLQSTTKHLDVQQKKNKLSHALENRPSPRGVLSQHSASLGRTVAATDDQRARP